SLPLELVLEILLYLFIDIRGKPHKRFASLSLVCKMWTPYAQRLLFRNVRLVHPDAAYSFLEATKPDGKNEANQRLRDSIRTLEVTIMSKKMADVLPFVLRHCPKLHEFVLKIHTKAELNMRFQPKTFPPELEFLSPIKYSDIPLPRFQALRINSDNNKSLYRIIREWPDIRHLVVIGEAMAEFSLNARSPEVEELFSRLHLYEFQTGRITNRSAAPTAGTLRASLTSSIGTLQILDLKGISDGLIGLSGPLFVEHGPHLRSLRLPYLSHHIKLPFLRNCVSLEEIVVYGLPSKHIISNLLLDKIQHASFSTLIAQERTPIRHILEWLHDFPSLSVLSWFTRRASGMDKAEAEIRELCKKKGVRLR
ncbi:hypothetical protein M408DRAFT_40894, partial [Serendipita vermifera MAFF 305830]